MRQIVLDVGQRQRLDAALLDGLDGLVAVPLGSERATRPFSVRMPFLALAVSDIQGIAMVGEGQGRGIPAGWNETANRAVLPIGDAYDGDRVVVGVGDVQKVALVID